MSREHETTYYSNKTHFILQKPNGVYELCKRGPNDTGSYVYDLPGKWVTRGGVIRLWRAEDDMNFIQRSALRISTGVSRFLTEWNWLMTHYRER